MAKKSIPTFEIITRTEITPDKLPAKFLDGESEKRIKELERQLQYWKNKADRSAVIIKDLSGKLDKFEDLKHKFRELGFIHEDSDELDN